MVVKNRLDNESVIALNRSDSEGVTLDVLSKVDSKYITKQTSTCMYLNYIILFLGKTAPIAEVDQGFLDQRLASLPTVPSHYCRNTPAYQKKKFFEPGTTLAKLFTKLLCFYTT